VLWDLGGRAPRTTARSDPYWADLSYKVGAHSAWHTQRHAPRRRPVAASPGYLRRQPAMDPEARRRACVEFRAKLSRDTGANLTATECEEVLGLVVKCTDEAGAYTRPLLSST